MNRGLPEEFRRAVAATRSRKRCLSAGCDDLPAGDLHDQRVRTPRKARHRIIGACGLIRKKGRSSADDLPQVSRQHQHLAAEIALPNGQLSQSGLEPLPLQEVEQICNAGRVAPLVVVPADDLDEVAQADRLDSREDRAVGIATQVGRDQWQFRVAKDALERPVGSLLHGGIDLSGARILVQDGGEVDHADRRHGHAESHAGELALQFRNHEANSLRSTGARGDDIQGSGTSVSQVLRGSVDRPLAVGEGVHGGQQTTVDAKRLVKHLCHGGETVGGAGRIRDDVMLGGIVHPVIHAENDRQIFVLGRSGDDHLLHAVALVSDCLGGVGEETGALHNDVDVLAPPWNRAWLALGEDLDRAAVDDEVSAVGSHLALEGAVVGVECQQVCVGCGVGQVVDGNNLDVTVEAELFEDGAKGKAADAAESVNADANGHVITPVGFVDGETIHGLQGPTQTGAAVRGRGRFWQFFAAGMLVMAVGAWLPRAQAQTLTPRANPADLDGIPLQGDDDPDLNSSRAWTRFLARAFADPVNPLTSLEAPDIRAPGPDSSDFPNSPYTLPRGWNYLEMSPLTYTASINTLQPESYSWNYLLRMGVTDRVEFRLYGNGLSWVNAGLGEPEVVGFAPLVFDTKIHFFEEDKELFVPATGMEIYVQTPWGTPDFDAGTQPGISLLFLNTLPWGWEVNWNVGLVTYETPDGGFNYTDSVQWSFARGITEHTSIFLQGFQNQAALPRPASQTVLGGGMVHNINRRFTIFGSFNAATNKSGPATTYYVGGAGAF